MNDISSQFVNGKHFIIHNDGFVVHKKSQILYQLFTIAVWKMAHNFLPSYFKMSLVSTYVVCERLSVMHQPARLPENFDQISPKHPCSGISFQNSPPPPWKLKLFPESKSGLTQNPPPQMKNSNFLSRVQIWAYPEHSPPPRKWKTLTFFPEFRSELTQNTPQKMKNSNFLSWVQIWAYPEHTPPPPLKNEKI